MKLLVLTLALATSHAFAMHPDDAQKLSIARTQGDTKTLHELAQKYELKHLMDDLANNRVVPCSDPNIAAMDEKITHESNQTSLSSSSAAKTKEIKIQQEQAATRALIWQKTKEACKPTIEAIDKNIDLLATTIPQLNSLPKELRHIVFEYAGYPPIIVQKYAVFDDLAKRDETAFDDSESHRTDTIKNPQCFLLDGTVLNRGVDFFSIGYKHQQYDYALLEPRGNGNIGIVYLMNTQDGKEVARYTHGGKIIYTQISKDLVTSTGTDNTARVWGLYGNELVRFVHDQPIYSAVFNRSNSELLVRCPAKKGKTYLMETYYLWNIPKIPDTLTTNQIALMLTLNQRRREQIRNARPTHPFILFLQDKFFTIDHNRCTMPDNVTIKLNEEEMLVLKSFSESLQKTFIRNYNIIQLTPETISKTAPITTSNANVCKKIWDQIPGTRKKIGQTLLALLLFITFSHLYLNYQN